MSTITNDPDQRMASWSSGEPGGGRSDDDHRSAVRRRVLWAVGGVLIVVLLVAGVLFGVTLQLANQVNRIPGAFAGLNEAARPAPGAGQTFLLVGTDSRAPGDTTGTAATGPDAVPGAQRSDVIMLATVAADGSHASLVSIPRDSWVDVPGRGMNKINAAYSFGGPSLLVSTVEQLTRVRVDHFAVIDFAGFAQLTDAVDGINVSVAAPTSNDGVNFVAGPQHLAGTQALAYVRQRYGLPGGDFDRVRREQNAMRALVNSAVSSGAVSNPFHAYGLADTLTRWVSVDDTMSNGDLRSLVWDLHGLRTRNIDFVTAPAAGTPMIGSQSVVLLDQRQGQDLWAALNAGQVGGYVTSHPGSALPVTPR